MSKLAYFRNTALNARYKNILYCARIAGI